MESQDWIALLSFIGALLSALYARWTYSEAKKANQIATHTHQKEIFDTFVSFRGEFLQLGEQFSDDSLFKLSVSANSCDFYLPSDLAEKLKDYSLLANKINFSHKRTKSYEQFNRDVPSEMWDEIWGNVDACRQLEPQIEEGLRDVLKLA